MTPQKLFDDQLLDFWLRNARFGTVGLGSGCKLFELQPSFGKLGRGILFRRCCHFNEADLVLPFMQFIGYYGLVSVSRQSFLRFGN